MSEETIIITALNDFIFCPVSIYFHNLDMDSDDMTLQSSDQLNGKASHNVVDKGIYSSRQAVLSGIPVYSERYGLFGKIDIFDTESKILMERKKKVKTVYDGYVFQLYAQYFALKEMGYNVYKLVIHSMDDNKSYPIALPEENIEMLCKFESLIQSMKSFEMENFIQSNSEKCQHCIYEPLCSFSVIKEEI